MQKRYYSLDVFRGATIAAMILVNNPGTWEHVYSPLRHAEWHGCTPTDLVFPFFLFAVGTAMSFVIPRFIEKGSNEFWKKILQRTVIIFLIGFFLNWFPFVHWVEGALRLMTWGGADNSKEGIRIMGVLQRIALAYFGASVLAFYFKPKQLLHVSVYTLLAYWLLCLIFGTDEPFLMNGWFGLPVDIYILGEAHLYHGEGVPFEPEGIVSTIPSIIQVVFGFIVGLFIKEQGKVDWLWGKAPNSNEKFFKLLAALFVTGFLLFVLALSWDLVFPINKKIWTSSYVLYSTSLAIMVIGVIIWYVEVLGARNWLTRFFDVFGKNPLFIFVLSMLLPSSMALIRIPFKGNYIDPLEWFYINICAKLPGTPEVGSLAFSICFLAIMWLVAYILDKRNIYIKV